MTFKARKPPMETTNNKFINWQCKIMVKKEIGVKLGWHALGFGMTVAACTASCSHSQEDN